MSLLEPLLAPSLLYQATDEEFMLHCSETWTMTSEDVWELEEKETSVPHWIGNISVNIQQNVTIWRTNLGIWGIRYSEQERRLHLYTHEMYMKSCTKRCWSLTVERTCGRGNRRNHETKWWGEIFRYWDLQRGFTP